LQRIVNKLPHAFIDIKKVTKLYIPVLNAPARIDITPAEVTIQRKRGRPIGSKDKNPRNKKEQNNAVSVTPVEVTDKIPERLSVKSQKRLEVEPQNRSLIKFEKKLRHRMIMRS
jgi:primase-polymerase (primpol)-like protein